MARGAVVLFDDPEGRQLLETHCARIKFPVADLEQLVEAVIDCQSSQRRRRLWREFDDLLDSQPDAELSPDAPETNRAP